MFWKPQRAKLWVGLSCSSKPVMAWWVHLNWQWAETYTSLVPAMPTVICRRLFYSDVTRQLIVLSVCKVAGPSLLHLPSLRYISMYPALSPRLLLYPSIWACAYIQVLTFLRHFSLPLLLVSGVNVDRNRCYVYKVELNSIFVDSFSKLNRQDVLVYSSSTYSDMQTLNSKNCSIAAAVEMKWIVGHLAVPSPHKSYLMQTWYKGKTQLHLGAQLAGRELGIRTLIKSRLMMIPKSSRTQWLRRIHSSD